MYICLASSWFMQNIKITCMRESLVYEVSNFHCFITEEISREPGFFLQIYSGEKSHKPSDHLVTLLSSRWRHRGLDVIILTICRNIDAVKYKNNILKRNSHRKSFAFSDSLDVSPRHSDVCGLSLGNTVGIKSQMIYTTLKIILISKRFKIMIHC